MVDDLAYDLISMFESHTKEETVNKLTEKYSEEVTRDEVMACWEQVDQLKKAGMLFSEDSFEPLQDELKRRSEGIVKALCLHVAHSCNLNCEYCFASQGKYSGERALMSFETGKRALDFLIEHSGSRRNLEVDFFGGEPLMNWQVVKDLVKYARSVEKQHNKYFRFTLTTNGMLIDDEVIEFSNREMSNVVLSLDGRREIHDRYRVDYEGRGSWGRIVPKFQEFVKRR